MKCQTNKLAKTKEFEKSREIRAAKQLNCDQFKIPCGISTN